MKNYFLLLVLLCFPNFSFGQIDQGNAIDSLFSDWNSPENPGASIGIIREGKLIFAKGYGLANMEYDIPNSDSTVFRIGSTSKQFTAACVILLAQQGKLSLEENLKSIFPDFPDYAKKITIRHLLNHTSGIRDYLQLAYLKGLREDDYFDDVEIMQWMINQSDLNFTPGEEYLYSNSGYWLLGQIVNTVAGMNMADFARKELFGPLGMNNTHFHNDHTAIVRQRASGYELKEDGEYRISMTTLNMIGDGGIFTTIKDIKKWDDAYYSDAFSEDFWKEMTRQGILNSGKVIDYASGLSIGEYKGLKTIRHGGAFVGFRAELLRFPEQKLSIAVFANRADANPSLKANQIADLLLKNLFVETTNRSGEPAKTLSPTVEFLPDQLGGNYVLMPGQMMQINIVNDSVNVLQSWNNTSYRIVKTLGNTYRIPGREGVSFVFSDLEGGFAQSLTILSGQREIKAARKEIVESSRIDLKDYTGRYYSKELDVFYHFEIENGVLKAGFDNKPSKMECSVFDQDQFTMDLGLVRFQRTGELVTGFELDSGRVKNLRFEKK